MFARLAKASIWRLSDDNRLKKRGGIGGPRTVARKCLSPSFSPQDPVTAEISDARDQLRLADPL